MTRLLGAVIAGGQSRRFGADKALALLSGVTLIDRVIAAIEPQVDGVLICGRPDQRYASVADRPRADLGPLGGLNAALHFARREGFDAVVSLPCDAPSLPDDLVAQLRAEPAPAFVRESPVIGLWPVGLADLLGDHLAAIEDRSMRAWARRAGASPVAVTGLVNINTPDDLRRAELSHASTRPFRSEHNVNAG